MILQYLGRGLDLSCCDFPFEENKYYDVPETLGGNLKQLYGTVFKGVNAPKKKPVIKVLMPHPKKYNFVMVRQQPEPEPEKEAVAADDKGGLEEL